MNLVRLLDQIQPQACSGGAGIDAAKRFENAIALRLRYAWTFIADIDRAGSTIAKGLAR